MSVLSCQWIPETPTARFGPVKSVELTMDGLLKECNLRKDGVLSYTQDKDKSIPAKVTVDCLEDCLESDDAYLPVHMLEIIDYSSAGQSRLSITQVERKGLVLRGRHGSHFGAYTYTRVGVFKFHIHHMKEWLSPEIGLDKKLKLYMEHVDWLRDGDFQDITLV